MKIKIDYQKLDATIFLNCLAIALLFGLFPVFWLDTINVVLVSAIIMSIIFLFSMAQYISFKIDLVRWELRGKKAEEIGLSIIDVITCYTCKKQTFIKKGEKFHCMHCGSQIITELIEGEKNG